MDENQQSTLFPASSVTQHEDAALKISMQFFADELLPYMGIEGKVLSFAPTELVHLEVKKFLQDFNLIMDNNTIKHFEFQSTNPGLEGLKRFRVYESLTSAQYKMPVTTYVLYSGNIKDPMTEFTEGINTYRVVPIIMQERNADDLFAELIKKLNTSETLSKQDLIPLTLCLLMSGTMPLKERVRNAFAITGKIENAAIPHYELQKMEAVIYTMAEKFLEPMETNEIKEAIRMTRLGQLIFNDGIEEGIVQGREIARLENEKKLMETARELLSYLDEQTIARILKLPLETIQQLKTENTTTK